MGMRMASQMVVRLISVLVGMVMLSLPAHAACGPSIELDVDQRDYRDSERFSGNDIETWAGIKLKIPLGEDYCEEQEFQAWQNAKAEAEEQEIKNIERLLRLCEKYGEDHKLLKGKCK